MARILGAGKNTLRINDNIGGGEIELYYRNPTTAERVAYSNESVSRSGRKVKMSVGDTRAKYGPKILTGIREGDFVDAEGRPIASDEESPNYRPDWKDLISEHAGDLVQLLAASVFEAAAELAEDEDLEKN